MYTTLHAIFMYSQTPFFVVKATIDHSSHLYCIYRQNYQKPERSLKLRIVPTLILIKCNIQQSISKQICIDNIHVECKLISSVLLAISFKWLIVCTLCYCINVEIFDLLKWALANIRINKHLQCNQITILSNSIYFIITTLTALRMSYWQATNMTRKTKDQNILMCVVYIFVRENVDVSFQSNQSYKRNDVVLNNNCFPNKSPICRAFWVNLNTFYNYII